MKVIQTWKIYELILRCQLKLDIISMFKKCVYFRRNFGDVEVEIFFDQHEFKDADILNINDIDLEENRDTDDEIEAEEGNGNNSNNEITG